MITIYTDGACSNNGKAYSGGGWAYIALLPDSSLIRRSGYVPATTNNRMELLSVINALKQCSGRITVISDSKYVVTGITEWVKSWKRNGWKTSTNKPVLNLDLWQELDVLVSSNINRITFLWVKGHNGDKYNEEVDRLAVSASKLT
jgi:ribonuclease HI